jgi:hypothetical protein
LVLPSKGKYYIDFVEVADERIHPGASFVFDEVEPCIHPLKVVMVATLRSWFKSF